MLAPPSQRHVKQQQQEEQDGGPAVSLPTWTLTRGSASLLRRA